jgi:hypothetical protein
VILRLYSPLQPFSDKRWRPREIEPLGANFDDHDTGQEAASARDDSLNR